VALVMGGGFCRFLKTSIPAVGAYFLLYVIIFASICTLARTCYIAAHGRNKRINGNRSTIYELVVIQKYSSLVSPRSSSTRNKSTNQMTPYSCGDL